MAFSFLDSVTLAGDGAKPNEDALGHSGHAAIVLDGATGLGENLMPGPSDAAWIAQFGVRRLLAHLGDGESAQDALGHALADAERSFVGLRRRAPKEKWETPLASMMLAAEAQDGFDALYFGDCAALVARPGEDVEIVGDALEKRVAEAARAAKLAAEKNILPTAGIRRPEFLDALRTARNRVNSGRNWLFGPDRRAASHAGASRVAAPPGTLVLLVTDGFLALVTDYRAYDAAGLVAAAREKGLDALGREIRAIEQADPEGQKFPRFKQSDDATALLFTIR